MSRRRDEDRDLEAYYKWLQLMKWDTNYYHMANEFPANTTQLKIYASNLKRKGKKSGFSDIVILEQKQGYGALFIELKTKTGRPSLAQYIFLNNVNNNGYLGVVAFGLDDAMKITKWYMQKTHEPLPVKIKERTSSGIKFQSMEVE